MSKKGTGIPQNNALSDVDYRELSMMQQAIFDGANYSIISTEVDGIIRSFNNAASRMLGYLPDELIGRCTPAFLRRMPIDALKIDTAFVKNMLSNDQDSIIVRSTIALAHNLNLNVVAEGVEDSETMSRLKEMGCDFVQGYYISRPRPWPEIELWLQENT